MGTTWTFFFIGIPSLSAGESPPTPSFYQIGTISQEFLDVCNTHMLVLLTVGAYMPYSLTKSPTMKDHSTFYKQVGEKIRSRRGKKLSQEALASAVGLTRTSISNIEKGRQRLLLHTLVDVADA